MTFALPVWCLYLPWVIALKDAEEQRTKTILCSSILIGPAAMAIWSLILQLIGGNPHKIWRGDPLIVGFLTTSLYVMTLKVLHRQQRAAS